MAENDGVRHVGPVVCHRELIDEVVAHLRICGEHCAVIDRSAAVSAARRRQARHQDRLRKFGCIAAKSIELRIAGRGGRVTRARACRRNRSGSRSLRYRLRRMVRPCPRNVRPRRSLTDP